MSLEQKVAQLLINKKKRLAIAESCTGGLLSNRLTNIPGSSAYLKLGVIAYSNEAKIKLLKIPPDLIKKHGAVSVEIACTMAGRVRGLLKTDFGVAITGIAGPSGATRRKPIGLTFIAVNTPVESLCVQYVFQGTRTSIKTQAANAALQLLAEFLESYA